MTRINSAIPVRCLTDEHLLAEHREIKRLPFCFKEAIKSGSIKKIPEKFKLGTGHVLFFLDKGEFTLNRYTELQKECRQRNFDVEDYSENWGCYFEEYMKWYIPTNEERELLIQRISQRIRDSSKETWHYKGRPITKEQAIKLLS